MLPVKYDKRRAAYWQRVGATFTDNGHTYTITAVDCNRTVVKDRGSKTLHYKHYDIELYAHQPKNGHDYEHIPCAELLTMKEVVWHEAKAHSANEDKHKTTMDDILNLNSDGTPIKLNEAKKSPYAVE